MPELPHQSDGIDVTTVSPITLVAIAEVDYRRAMDTAAERRRRLDDARAAAQRALGPDQVERVQLLDGSRWLVFKDSAGVVVIPVPDGEPDA
jgi:hypothetical protein